MAEFIVKWISVTLITLIGSACIPEKKMSEGKRVMEAKIDNAAHEALLTIEYTGALTNGVEIEFYVGGGLPPPYHRSEQFRLILHDGRTVFRFVTPDYTAAVKQGEPYPRHVYQILATPEEVMALAKLVRRSGAFTNPAPAAENLAADSLRTELIVVVKGKSYLRLYSGAEPAGLAALQKMVRQLIARLRDDGEHWIER
jgi:hypothetical protein